MQGAVIRPEARGKRRQVQFARMPARQARGPDAVTKGDALA